MKNIINMNNWHNNTIHKFNKEVKETEASYKIFVAQNISCSEYWQNAT